MVRVIADREVRKIELLVCLEASKACLRQFVKEAAVGDDLVEEKRAMIKALLSIPANIFLDTLHLTVWCFLTIIGIPIGIMVFICGIGLALVALVMVMIPISILFFI